MRCSVPSRSTIRIERQLPVGPRPMTRRIRMLRGRPLPSERRSSIIPVIVRSTIEPDVRGSGGGFFSVRPLGMRTPGSSSVPPYDCLRWSRPHGRHIRPCETRRKRLAETATHSHTPPNPSVTLTSTPSRSFTIPASAAVSIPLGSVHVFLTRSADRVCPDLLSADGRLSVPEGPMWPRAVLGSAWLNHHTMQRKPAAPRQGAW